jgi:hypothetical protein
MSERLGARTVLPLPTLVWIELDALKVVDSAPRPDAPQVSA